MALVAGKGPALGWTQVGQADRRIERKDVPMRVLVVGAGGVGSVFAHIAARRGNFERVVIADYDGDRAHKAAQSAADHFSGVQLDASDESSITELLRTESCDAVLNAVDPRFVMPIYRAALAAGVTYLDMAMSLSHPHPEEPYSKTGVKLGDEQFELAPQWEERGLLALAGMGVEPGLSDVFARHAADELFSSIDELGVRDGANLVVDGYEFCPDVLDLDDHRGVPERARHLGKGPWVVHDRAVQRARDVRLPSRHRSGRVRERRA